MACAYLGLGDSLQATACYRQALDIYREIGDPRGQQLTLVRLGDIHLAAGDIEAARDCWHQALDVHDLPLQESEPIRARLAKISTDRPPDLRTDN